MPPGSTASSTVNGAPIERPADVHLKQWDELAPFRVNYRAPFTTEQMLADPEIFRRVCGIHGLGRPTTLDADVQHLIAPVVGMMSMGADISYERHAWLQERLALVLALARMPADD